jgi:hypothetical protein
MTNFQTQLHQGLSDAGGLGAVWVCVCDRVGVDVYRNSEIFPFVGWGLKERRQVVLLATLSCFNLSFEILQTLYEFLK